MTHIDREAGVFGPNELKEMRDQLDREAAPGETEVERELRATEIIQRRRIEHARPHLPAADRDAVASA